MNKKTVLTIYDEISNWFDSVRSKTLFEQEWLDFVLSELPLNASVLDLGCGTAEPIAKYLINRGCKITGVDGSQNMIAYCQERFPDHRWLVEDMRHYESTERFDGIIAWDSFFHLNGEDQRNMFPSFAKHSRPGGILVFSSGTSEGEGWSPMHGHDNAQMFHASLDTREYRVLLEQYGFTVLKYVETDPNCRGHTYWIAQKSTGPGFIPIR